MGFSPIGGSKRVSKKPVASYKKAAASKSSSSKPASSKTASSKPASTMSVFNNTLSSRTYRKKKACKPFPHKKLVCKMIKKRASVFRAVSGANQTVMMGTFTKVQFQIEELDLNNEYNSATSTFRPEQSGIYSLLAAVSFTSITITDYTLLLEIRVNNVARLSDEENFRPRTGIISAAGILKLNAGDRVEVFLRATGENGEILSGLATHFEGAKIDIDVLG